MTVLVLAHARSGSSLLMQTLNYFGIPVAGKYERKDLPYQANPKGYYEDREVLSSGLSHKLLKHSSKIKNHAFKVAFTPVLEDALDLTLLDELVDHILIPYRNPVESSCSVTVFGHKMMNKKILFFTATKYLKEYTDSYYRFVQQIHKNGNESLRRKIAFIPYNLAISNREHYIESIQQHLGLTLNDIQKESAIKNIDPDLYRFQESCLDKDILRWSQHIGAQEIYQLISRYSDTDVWKQIEQLRIQKGY